MAFQLYFVTLLAFLASTYAARDSEDDEFPFQVSVKTLNGEHICGGIIVTSKWVLTSADCAKDFQRLQIGYGNVDTQQMQKFILSRRIEIEKDLPSITNLLALIELEEEIKFDSRTKQARLPRDNVHLVNGTISGWKANPLLIHQWTLKVIEMNELTYVTRDCKTHNGSPLNLLIDQYCLILDPAEFTSLASIGAAITRSDVLLGFYARKKLTPLSPILFLDVSHHAQWIDDTLQEDSKDIKWANKVPSSAETNSAVSLAVLGMSYLFVRYF